MLYDVVNINIIHQFNEPQYNSHECSPLHNEITSASLESSAAKRVLECPECSPFHNEITSASLEPGAAQ